MLCIWKYMEVHQGYGMYKKVYVVCMEVYGSISRLWNVYLSLCCVYGSIWKYIKDMECISRSRFCIWNYMEAYESISRLWNVLQNL